MSATTPHGSSAGTPDPRASFFRQSGWLMIANVSAGGLMWAVHLLSKFIPEGEYGDFGALLAAVMILPTLPLQMLMAQQTARAMATGHIREMSGVIRSGGLLMFSLWLVLALVVLFFQGELLARWKMSSPAGLYLTLIILLISVLMPLLWGVLQGKQDFLWLGATMILNGAGRFAFAAVAVIVFHAYAAGMVAGVLFGIVVAFAVAVWRTRMIWSEPPSPFDRAALLRDVAPLLLGFLGFQILFTADTMFVKAYFGSEEAGYYVGAGTLSRALMWLVLPLAAVLFPRLVHNAVKSQKSDLMGLVLLGTGVLAVVGAGMLWLLGPWVVRFVYKPSYVEAVTAILPWYAFAMVPLAVANVLLNNLLARPGGSFWPGACVLGLAGLYLLALTRYNASLVQVLQTMGLFNLAFLVVCGAFSWQASRRDALASARAQADGLGGPGKG